MVYWNLSVIYRYGGSSIARLFTIVMHKLEDAEIY
jgi:hypothetical protein